MALTGQAAQILRDAKAINERMAWAARTYGLDSSEYEHQLIQFDSIFRNSNVDTYTAVSGAKSISLSQQNIQNIANDLFESARVKAALGDIDDQGRVTPGLIETPSVFLEEDARARNMYEAEHGGRTPNKRQLERFKKVKDFVKEYMEDQSVWYPENFYADDEEMQNAWDDYLGVMHKSHKTYEEMYEAITKFEGLKYQAYKANWRLMKKGGFTPRLMNKSTTSTAKMMADINRMKGL